MNNETTTFGQHDLNVENCFRTIVQFVIQAGQVVTEGFHNNNHFDTKIADWDLVTEYDKRVEKLLIDQISAIYPTHKFIGEESSDKDSILTDEPTWLIDPIDGTTNFVHNNPHSCISIALSINKEIIIGIVYNPLMDQLFTAQKGNGAFLNGKPIHVSKVTDISKSLIGFEISLARIPQIHDKFIARFNEFICQAHGVRTMGSAALSLCYVAMGAWDAYQVDHLNCWDNSAGALIIKEAGGTVIDTSGGEFQIMNQKILTASTPQLAEQLVNIIKKADASLVKNGENNTQQ